MAFATFAMLASFLLSAQAQRKDRPVEHPTFYREVLSVLLVENSRRGRWLEPLEQSFRIELIAWQARVSAVESRKLALCAAECVDHPVGKAAKK
ncbi:MAG: hypothetical protein DMG60_10505 [Acidobacteria bacterium]|nr:MAG: hypothetical protein DMG60_10505 [Acidobacteriota bacterium]